MAKMRRNLSAMVFCLFFSIPFNSRAEVISDLVGMNILQAETFAKSLNIKLEIARVASPERRGTIISQSPAAGSTIPENGTLRVEQSDGLLVPDLRGLSLAEAQSKLAAFGIESLPSSRRHIGVEKDVVVQTVPRAAQPIDADLEIVFLDASHGRDVTIPPVVGKKLGEAAKLVSNSELLVKLDPPPEKEKLMCGLNYRYDLKVTESVPGEGENVFAMSEVTLRYSSMIIDSYEVLCDKFGNIL